MFRFLDSLNPKGLRFFSIASINFHYQYVPRIPAIIEQLKKLCESDRMSIEKKFSEPGKVNSLVQEVHLALILVRINSEFF